MSEFKVMSDDEIRDFCLRKDYEIFKKDKEIERLENIIKGLDNTIENLEEVVERKDNIIKEVREYIEEKEKDDDNWIDYELCIEPVVIKKILDKAGDEK